MKVSVIILTYNSERILEATLTSALQVSDDIHVVDSFSTDGTLEIARRFGVNVVQHEFVNYAMQRNWAIEHLPIKHSWELHLDADEQLSAKLADEILHLEDPPLDSIKGFLIPRLTYFLGRPIRHGGMYPIWHLRLFRHGAGRCEEREYDQHFYVDGRVAKLKHPILDRQCISLDEWTARHNRWASAEAAEILRRKSEASIRGFLFGNPIEVKRFWKNVYYRFPLFVRPFLFFFYRYILRGGFLDGKEGLVFFVLQSLWFRFLVDAKIYENRAQMKRQRAC